MACATAPYLRNKHSIQATLALVAVYFVPENAIPVVDGIAVETGQQSGFRGFYIDTKMLDNFFELIVA